jgi:hypothetical protein
MFDSFLSPLRTGLAWLLYFPSVKLPIERQDFIRWNWIEWEESYTSYLLEKQKQRVPLASGCATSHPINSENPDNWVPPNYPLSWLSSQAMSRVISRNANGNKSHFQLSPHPHSSSPWSTPPLPKGRQMQSIPCLLTLSLTPAQINLTRWETIIPQLESQIDPSVVYLSSSWAKLTRSHSYFSHHTAILINSLLAIHRILISWDIYFRLSFILNITHNRLFRDCLYSTYVLCNVWTRIETVCELLEFRSLLGWTYLKVNYRVKRLFIKLKQYF